jgi:ABC-2 type transport system permease protein
VGFTFSTVARNQLQAMRMTFFFFFFFLPLILLSGFMCPFRAMPQWAQHVGEILPLTHFLRIVRGILLNGNVASQLWGELWQMLVFLLVAGLIALRRYRQAID